MNTDCDQWSFDSPCKEWRQKCFLFNLKSKNIVLNIKSFEILVIQMNYDSLNCAPRQAIKNFKIVSGIKPPVGHWKRWPFDKLSPRPDTGRSSVSPFGRRRMSALSSRPEFPSSDSSEILLFVFQYFSLKMRLAYFGHCSLLVCFRSLRDREDVET